MSKVEVAVGMACIVLLFTTPALARSFPRVAQSGVATRVYTYHSWNPDCTNKGGIIKVLTKPQHGTVRHFSNTSAPAAVNHPCSHILMEGFQVDYTSIPGFRSTDSFVLEVSFPNRPRWVDTFSVDVNRAFLNALPATNLTADYSPTAPTLR
jgi:hypothetical protein